MGVYSWSCSLFVTIVVLVFPIHARPAENFTELLAADPTLATVSNLLDKAGISLSDSDVKTLFVPTSDAFDTLRTKNGSLWDKYTTNLEYYVHLREVLNWHLVTEGAFLIKDIFDGSREFLENSIQNITFQLGTGTITVFGERHDEEIAEDAPCGFVEGRTN